MTITGPAGNVIASTEVVPIDGFISSEFARACIEIKEYLPNIETTVAGSMFATRNNLQSTRNCPSSSDSFWTLLVTSDFSFEDNQYCSSEEGKILGVCSSFFLTPYNCRIGIFNIDIDSAVYNWNNSHPDKLIHDQKEVVRKVVLHEMGHAMGLEHCLNSPMAESVFYIRVSDNLTLSVWGESWQTVFTYEQIQQIQARSKPHNASSEQGLSN